MQICKDLLTNSGKFCDLHTHTNFSDGSLSPAELIAEAERCGLYAVALTDHNTLGGVPELLEAARRSTVKAISGIEFSTDYHGTELHLVALGVREDKFFTVSELMDEVREHKRLAMDKLVSDLLAAGYLIEPERIYAGVQGIINRAHVATELVRCGYATSRGDAFDRILYSGGPFYREPKYISTEACIDFVESLGAVSVLAHPLLNIGEERLRELLSSTRGRLKAVEVLYSEYDEKETVLSASLAEEFGLMPSGGSDFHGKNKPDIALGTGRGNLRIPLAFAENMGLLD